MKALRPRQWTFRQATEGIFRRIMRFPRIAKRLDHAAVLFHRMHENENGNRQTNGEAWLLQTLAAAGKLSTVFDVGAHRGDWTALALEANPQAVVHCFEICPPTFERLAARYRGDTRVFTNPFGLFETAGEIPVKYCPEADFLSSAVEIVLVPDAKTILARVERGGAYCVRQGLKHIDLLKLDVEGAEHMVLRGFGEMVTPDQIPVIQFEYGQVNIVSKFLLRDFHAFFNERGYRVGKLFPGFVRFRTYRYDVVDFIGYNYVAAADDYLCGQLQPGGL
jgi:FkbM family methyltransferase